MYCSSDCYILLASILFVASATLGISQESVQVRAPDRSVSATVVLNDAGRPMIRARLSNQTALEPGKLGITVEGTDLGDGVIPLESASYTIDRKYAWRGNTSTARNHANGRTITFRHEASGQKWMLDVRVYDSGVAWRYIVPGDGTRRVNGETSTFNLPGGTQLWYQTNTEIYEGNFQSARLTEENPGSAPEVIGPPATGKLPGGGYVTLAESDVLHYSGSSLTRTGGTTFRVQFHDNPGGWDMEGRIHSPWRVAIIAPDLNELVNSNLVAHLVPAPDRSLFPDGVQTDWVKPGRSWWTWYVYDDDGARWGRQKTFVDEAAQLNCRFHLVDAGWEGGRGWTDGNRSKWDRLNELCEYASDRDVGIWVWTAAYNGTSGRASPGLETRPKRKRFFQNLAEAGAVGVKIDYFNDQSHRSMEIMRGCLRQAAKHEIMINFHGVSPPAGQARTWPNEMTREGVRAMEHNKWASSTLEHWTALPFTRFVVGHGDVTPGIVPPDKLKNLTATSQLAMATMYTSPYLCWAGTYERFRESGVTDVVKHLPTTWDETQVLPGSTIGKRAVMARRNGNRWYLAGLRGSSDYGDPVFRSEVLTGTDGPEEIEVSLEEADHLVLRTTTTEDGYDHDHTNWAEATLVKPNGERVKLSSLTPVRSEQGWGSLKTNQSITGHPLTIGNQTYNHGLGTHADSLVVYELDQTYRSFQAEIGIDEEAGKNGRARFIVHTTSMNQVMTPDLSFLGEGSYRATLVQDGTEKGSFRVRTKTNVSADSTWSLPVRAGGGFLVILRPE